MGRTFTRITAGLLVIGTVAGCATKAGTGAVVGGAGGAAAGAAIGSMSHSRAGEGALIGGAIGALGGALIGHSMDKADQRNAEQDRTAASREYDRRHVARAEDRVTKTDVITWTNRGLSDDVIIDRVERSDTVFRLTAADETDLRDNGVSESVIRAMKRTARR